MNLKHVLEKVAIENIYQHIMELEGIRHPLDTPEKLDEAADYIKNQMKKYGISVREQIFKVNGFQQNFRNIEGWVGTEGPSAVLIAHYDTVYNSPGANDNAAGIAVILEVARVLGNLKNPPNVRFLGVTLEEENLVIDAKFRKLAKKYNIVDEKLRYKTPQISALMKKHNKLVGNLTFSERKSRYEAIREANIQLKQEIPSNLYKYLIEYENFFSKFTPETRMGKLSKVGSNKWVNEAIEKKKVISYYICLDEIGTTFDYEYSQYFPPNVVDMLDTFKVDLEKKIANFEMIITNSDESNIGKIFRKYCKDPEIDLPFAYLNLQMDYDQVVKMFPKALSSDHAPFMKEGIPGLFLFDTSVLRHTFVHSPCDTINKLDFTLIEKICKAIIATLLNPNL